MNPAIMPDGFLYEEYMRVCLSMIDVCDAVYMLPCWKDSPGAMFEKQYAEFNGKKILYNEEVTGG